MGIFFNIFQGSYRVINATMFHETFKRKLNILSLLFRNGVHVNIRINFQMKDLVYRESFQPFESNKKVNKRINCGYLYDSG